MGKVIGTWEGDDDPVTPLSGMIVRPGDTLIVTWAGRRLNTIDHEDLKAKIMQGMPGLGGVVFMDNVAGLNVYRPDATSSELDS